MRVSLPSWDYHDISAGFAVAEAALISQASQVIIASSSSQKVDAAVAKLQNLKTAGKVSGSTVDAKDGRSVKALLDSVGEIDHLVWTSGDALKMGFPDVDLETSKGTHLYMN